MRKVFIFLILILFIRIFTYSQTYTTTSTGNWTTGSIWVGNVAPTLSGAAGQLNNNVIISVGNVVSLTGNLTIKSGITLTIRGKLVVASSGSVDFQNGSTIIVETGGTLEMNGLTNSNNSTNVTINGKLIVNGNYQAGSGSAISGNGTLNVSGTTSGTGTTFGQVLSCNNCTAMTGSILDIIVDGNVQNIDIPMDCYYRYNYTEQIYYKSEINKDGNIASLSFEYDGYESFTEPIKLYLGHTSKTQFSGSNDWIKSSNMQLVYAGNYILNSVAGWYTINFSTPFYYNNIDNLVIGFYEYGYDYHSSSADFYSSSTLPNNRVIYFDSDSQNPNPSSPPAATGTWYYTPSLQLKIEQPPIALPIELISFKGTTKNNVNTLTWVTISEYNNEYFTLERTSNGIDFNIIANLNGAGTSHTTNEYTVIDAISEPLIYYYKLKQTDYNGVFKYTDLISVDNRIKAKIVSRMVSLMGTEVNESYRGMVIIEYTDGSIEKIIR